MDLWKEELTVLESWMTQNKIHSELEHLFIKCAEAWIHSTPHTYSPTNEHLQKALKLQNKTGWFLFIQGFWVD